MYSGTQAYKMCVCHFSPGLCRKSYIVRHNRFRALSEVSHGKRGVPPLPLQPLRNCSYTSTHVRNTLTYSPGLSHFGGFQAKKLLFRSCGIKTIFLQRLGEEALRVFFFSVLSPDENVLWPGKLYSLQTGV